MSVQHEEQSITRWFAGLRDGDGDDEAATLLWQHYFPRLVELARHRFGADRNAVYDADDAAQSVFHLLCRGARLGRFEEVAGRDDLWRLLVTATRRRVIDQVRRQGAVKRGGGNCQPVDAAADLQSPEPTPETIAMLDEQLQCLLNALRDDTLRRIAVWRLEGFSNVEIAGELNVSERTVERKLRLIRGDWQKLI